MRPIALVVTSLVVAVLAAAAASTAAAARSPNATTSRTAVAAFSRAPSPVLVEQAIDNGRLDSVTGHLFLAYALFAPDKLPAAYQSETPFHGTVWLLKLREALETLPEGAARTEIETLLGTEAGAIGPGTSICELSPLPTVNVLETAHFYIEYNEAEVDNSPDGLTIADFADSLEHTWTTEIDAFRWAAPPKHPTTPVPNGKYLVKIQQLSPVLYGYVSNFGTGAGLVGDNPATSWNDGDAYASCMGLNSDYAFFPGSPRRALDATTAHEFNHSIQFGVGALHGPNAPDSVFVEGGATWMEDEAYDTANDNYNYLWPNFGNDMGEYEDSPYPYWITFRGLTERFGASRPSRGEDVMQAFWEITSRNEASNLDALELALQTRRVRLTDAYHAYATAVKFNKACGGGYKLPYCFEEGRQYVNGDGVQTGAGETAPTGTIAGVGGSFSGSVPDNFALDWVVLPRRAEAYTVTLANTSAGGAFRASVVCDTGSTLKVTLFAAELGPGTRVRRATVTDSSACVQAVAVITNVAKTSANPDTTVERTYRLSTS